MPAGLWSVIEHGRDRDGDQNGTAPADTRQPRRHRVRGRTDPVSILTDRLDPKRSRRHAQAKAERLQHRFLHRPDQRHEGVGCDRRAEHADLCVRRDRAECARRATLHPFDVHTDTVLRNGGDAVAPSVRDRAAEARPRRDERLAARAGHDRDQASGEVLQSLVTAVGLLEREPAGKPVGTRVACESAEPVELTVGKLAEPSNVVRAGHGRDDVNAHDRSSAIERRDVVLVLSSYVILLALSAANLLARRGAVAISGRSLVRASVLLLALATVEMIVQDDGLSRAMAVIAAVVLVLSWTARRAVLVLGGDRAASRALIAAALGRVRASFHQEGDRWTITGGVRPAVLRADLLLSGALLLRFSGAWDENRPRLAAALIRKGFRAILPVLRIRISE